MSSKKSSYRIVFTEGGERKQIWAGYASYAEARRALNDADLIIPINWHSEIEAYQPETPKVSRACGPIPRFDYENACSSCGPTCEC